MVLLRLRNGLRNGMGCRRMEESCYWGRRWKGLHDGEVGVEVDRSVGKVVARWWERRKSLVY